MFENVSVGVSDDESALDAVALARTLVASYGTLTLVHVETGDAPASRPAPLLSLADADGTPLPLAVVAAASPGAGLHDYAIRAGSDLIVVGASRQRRLRRTLA